MVPRNSGLSALLLLALVLFVTPARGDEWDPVVLLVNGWRLIKPQDRVGENPGDYTEERAALEAFIESENASLHFNALGYRMDNDVFVRVNPSSPCLDLPGCNGIWPVPRVSEDLMAAFDVQNESWLNDLGPFRGQYSPGQPTVDAWLIPNRLTQPMDRRLCMEDPNYRGQLAGGAGGCGCAFTHEEVVSYLRDQLRYVHDRAEAVEPGLFAERVRGLHLNLEEYAFPRVLWPAGDEEDNGFPQLMALPGVCAATGTAFNTEDFDGDNQPDNRHTAGGVAMSTDEVTDLDLFLQDVEFNYPQMGLAWDDIPLGSFEFGSTSRAAVSQSFVLDMNNNKISRIDLRISRPIEGYAPKPLYHVLAATNWDGSPDMSVHTKPRPNRQKWFPHRDFPNRDWISLFIDPNEAQQLFAPGERVAIVVYTIGTDETPLPAYDTYAVDYEMRIPPATAFVIDTDGDDPPGAYSAIELNGLIQHRVWYAADHPYSAHDDWIVFQNRRVGRVMARVNDALNKNGPPPAGRPDLSNVALWPFAHFPEVENNHLEQREWYGADITEDHLGQGTSSQLDGVQLGYIGSLETINGAYATRVMPTVHQVTDENDPPNWSRKDIHEVSVWDFAVGGLSVFALNSFPSGSQYGIWKTLQLPKLRGFTAPARVFPEHYRWVNQGHIPVKSEYTSTYELSSLCPSTDCTSGIFGTGHLLVANTSETNSVTVDMMNRMRSLGWVHAVSPAGSQFVPLVVDEMVVYKQQEFLGPEVPVNAYEICAGDLSINVSLLPKSDDNLESIVFASYATRPDQPAVFTTGRPGGGYCTDELIEVRWEPVPASCYEQRGIDDVLVSITFELLLDPPGPSQPEWTPVYYPVLGGLDDGVEYIDVCGGYPPSCPEEYFGVLWRARIQMDAISNGTNFAINEGISDEFVVHKETSAQCTTGGCPYVGGVTLSGHVYDNNVLAYSGDGSRTVDYYRLQIAPAPIDSVFHLTLTETATDVSSIDSVGVVVVDHRTNSELAVSHNGEIYCFDGTSPLWDAIDASGRDVTALLAADHDSLNVHAFDGDYVVMNVGVADSSSALIVISDIKHGFSSVLVQVPDGQEGWRTAERIEPRDKWGEDVVSLTTLGYGAGDSVKVRFYWTDEHKVDFVALTRGARGASIARSPLRYAEHAVLGDVTAELTNTNVGRVPLAADDIILLGFDVPPQTPTTVRDIIFVTAGTWTSADETHSRHARRAPSPTATLRIMGARPARGALMVRVQARVGTQASLRIFDLQGRLVRTLLDGRLESSQELLMWDLSDNGHRRVGRGVYFARLEASGSPPRVEKLHVLE